MPINSILDYEESMGIFAESVKVDPIIYTFFAVYREISDTYAPVLLKN